LDDQLIVFPKVRLADLVYMPKGTADRQTHFNRIQSKHVDFVLCDREKIRPVLVIELDDASHEEEARRDRDTFVDASLSAAGLPILHIPAQRSYIPAELAAAVHQKLQPVSGSAVGVIVSLRA
jgi:very-short-patch-repair endonuclease